MLACKIDIYDFFSVFIQRASCYSITHKIMLLVCSAYKWHVSHDLIPQQASPVTSLFLFLGVCDRKQWSSGIPAQGKGIIDGVSGAFIVIHICNECHVTVLSHLLHTSVCAYVSKCCTKCSPSLIHTFHLFLLFMCNNCS